MRGPFQYDNAAAAIAAIWSLREQLAGSGERDPCRSAAGPFARSFSGLPGKPDLDPGRRAQWRGGSGTGCEPARLRLSRSVARGAGGPRGQVARGDRVAADALRVRLVSRPERRSARHARRRCSSERLGWGPAFALDCGACGISIQRSTPPRQPPKPATVLVVGSFTTVGGAALTRRVSRPGPRLDGSAGQGRSGVCPGYYPIENNSYISGPRGFTSGGMLYSRPFGERSNGLKALPAMQRSRIRVETYARRRKEAVGGGGRDRRAGGHLRTRCCSRTRRRRPQPPLPVSHAG
jgi:hypothetical protein